ncbi:hypothetical protein PVBG_06230 [Plasmodium vivax Brazil I]|uniref:Variable surface protein n=1 Tax=Plasmodium vivax (strain Brazil I) TaxID=1033975 RepID=A0A0J9SK69_PLAV1|nr:hypothetical protein PVBG_06230 [Plasmodium vivax Brazil I]
MIFIDQSYLYNIRFQFIYFYLYLKVKIVILKWQIYLNISFPSNNKNDIIKNFSKSKETLYEHDKILNMNFTRLLARHEQNREFEPTSLREKLSERSIYKNERNAYDNISAYSRVNTKASNNIDVYMKNYKHRYEKKKGVSKLDCYCEKKIFDNINYINDLSEKLHNNKKLYNNIILKKYVIRFILLSSFPMLGIIIPILFVGDKGEQVIPHCFAINHDAYAKGGKSCTLPNISGNIIGPIVFFNTLIFYILSIINILLVIYTFIKYIKYEKIKCGKGKMNRNEYIHFCKEVFNLK